MPKFLNRSLLAPLVLFGLSCWAYLSRLLPGVGFWDTGVFQAVPWTLSFTHPTGYPTYVLLGKLFCALFPFGSIAWRMNLLSALSGAAAVVMLFLLVRALGVEEELGIAAALSLGFAQIFWRTAVRADPHTLHAFLFLFLLYLALRWYRQPTTRRLTMLALTLGLALGNHMMTIMLAPALLAFVLWVDPGLLRRRTLLFPLGAGLAGISVYLYLPIRSWMGPPIRADYPLHTWNNFWHYVLGQDFKGAMGFLSYGGPHTALSNLPRFVESLSGSLTPFGFWLMVGLALVGLLRLSRRDRHLTLLFSLALLVPLYASLTYVNGDIERYYFNALEVLLVFAALGGNTLLTLYDGIRGLVERVERLEAGLMALKKPRLAPAPTPEPLPQETSLSRWPDWRGWTFLVILLPLMLIPINRGRIWTPSADGFGRELLPRLKPHALVMSWWNYSAPLWYFHFVEGKRPDLEIVNGIDKIPEELAHRYDGSRPVYLIQPADQIDRLSRKYRLKRLEGMGDAVYEVEGKNE